MNRLMSIHQKLETVPLLYMFLWPISNDIYFLLTGTLEQQRLNQLKSIYRRLFYIMKYCYNFNNVKILANLLGIIILLILQLFV